MKYRRNPFGDFFEIQKQVDQRFDSFFQEPSASSTLAARSDHWRPPMDVYETGDTFIVRVELPGIEPEQDVQIELVDNVLTIRGYRRDRSQRNKQHYHLAEVSYGPFERAVRLPDAIDDENDSATWFGDIEHGFNRMVSGRKSHFTPDISKRPR